MVSERAARSCHPVGCVSVHACHGLHGYPASAAAVRAQCMCRYEPGDIGGRTQTFEHEGHVYEMGASIIHGQNRYLRDLADAMGLQRHSVGSDGSLISIFDGQRFVFNESSWTVVTLFRMLQR